MSKSENQKQKLLALLDILKKNTDEDHGITMVQILEELEARGVKAERRAIYTDIDNRECYRPDSIHTFTKNHSLVK